MIKSLLPNRLRFSLASAAKTAGFTMIELLVVITILGILAVAVLSAINPVEQINRGRDTGRRSDAEQLLSAMDRYNAFVGYEPYRLDETTTRGLALTDATRSWSVTGLATCSVFTRLGTEDSSTVNCTDTDELKEAFLTRLDDMADPLVVYNNSATATGTDSTYVCFNPQSSAFRTEAATRCGGTTGPGLPTDLRPIADTVCAAGAEMICLP